MDSQESSVKGIQPETDSGYSTMRRTDARLLISGQPGGMISRIVNGITLRFWHRLDRALFVLVRKGADWLSTERTAALKSSLKPITRLDYEDDQILMCASSPLHIDRAYACRKEPETVEWIRQQVRRGDVFFDVGANVGAYSLLAARISDGEVIIHAFEPSYSTYYDLCNNILLNRCQNAVIPHLMALARTSGVSVFNYSSLNSGAAVHSLGESVDYRGEEFEPEYQQSVMCYSIDDLVGVHGFPVPNLLKIDVDGIELEIVMGTVNTLNDSRVRSILVEVYEPGDRCQEVVELITSKGFELCVRAQHPNGVANYVFGRKAEFST